MQRYQGLEVEEGLEGGLEESMKGSGVIFGSVNLLHCHLQKTRLKRTGLSYIDSPEWLKNRQETINPKNNDNNCFQYALKVVLNYENIKKDPERYQKLSLLLINMIGNEQIFHHKKKTGKSLNQITTQLLLIFYLFHAMLKT